jgi:signal transduction histidine kinase
MAQSAAERGGFKTELHLEKELDMLPESATHCLYRCAQESIENALRHANAKKVTIRLAGEGEQVALTITDDGAGFDPAEQSQDRLGLRGMRERVEMLGGHLSVASAKKQGTTVTVRLGRKP